MRRTVETSTKTPPILFQFRMLERGPILVQFWKFIYFIWANMSRATHIPRFTGGNARIIREGSAKARSRGLCTHQDKLPAPVDGGGPADAARGRLNRRRPSVRTDSIQNTKLLEIRGHRHIAVQSSKSSSFSHVCQYVVSTGCYVTAEA